MRAAVDEGLPMALNESTRRTTRSRSTNRGFRGRRLWSALLMPTLTLHGCTAPLTDEPMRGSASSQLVDHAIEGHASCVAVAGAEGLLADYETTKTTPAPAFSITKSVASLLVGIAQDKGYLTLDSPVSAFVEQWRGTASENVTIRDILTNTSGREWDSRSDYVTMALQADDKTAFAIDLGQEATPGETWVYNNSAVQVLEAVLESATSMAADEFADQHLFGPLDMRHSRIEKDAAGNANLFAGLRTTCSDLIRLGQMLLARGKAPSGEQVLSESYLQSAVGSPSTDLNAAYGFLWWLNHPGAAQTPEVAVSGKGGAIQGPLVPDAPADAFWALGFHNQILLVIPSLNVVAVRLGENPPADSPFSMRTFTEDVLRLLGDR